MKARVLFAQISFLVLVIGAWEFGDRVGAIDPKLLPPPSEVATTLWALLQNSSFLANASDTIVRVIASFLIGAPIAIALGFVMGENLSIGRSLSPIFNLVLAVPQSIFLPVFVLVFGLGFTDFRHYPRRIRRRSERDGGCA